MKAGASGRSWRASSVLALLITLWSPLASSTYGAGGDPSIDASGSALVATFAALNAVDATVFTFDDRLPLASNRAQPEQIRQWFVATFQRAVEARRRAAQVQGGVAWVVDMQEEPAMRSLVRVRIEGDEVPDRRALYVYALFLTSREGSRPVEYRVVIGRDAYERFLLDEQAFADEWLPKARRVLALACGYRPSSFGPDFARMVQVADWHYEMSRLGESAPLRQGGRRTVSSPGE